MGKGKKKNRTAAKFVAVKAVPVRMVGAVSERHPLVMEALGNGARLDRGTFEVVPIPNPHGEVMQGSEIRGHRGIRVVPMLETLHRRGAIGAELMPALRWYAEQLALSESGLVKCALALAGSAGGSVDCHVPVNLAAMEARADVAWARRLLRHGAELVALDGVIAHDWSFAEIGAVSYPFLSGEAARKKAGKDFKLAANRLMVAGCGDFWKGAV